MQTFRTGLETSSPRQATLVRRQVLGRSKMLIDFFSQQVQYFCKIALKDSTSTIHKNQQVFIVMNPIDLNLENKCLIVSAKLASGRSEKSLDQTPLADRAY